MRSRLLVVDDDPEQLAEISEYLLRSGFDVVTAHDGFHALEQIAEHRPRVIMLDVNMPGWNGVRVADAARNLDHRAIVILMTADADAYREANEADCGAVTVFSKPVALPKLTGFLRSVLGEIGTETEDLPS